MPAQSGVLNPIAEIAQMTTKVGSLTLVDACQTLGQAPLDVKKQGIDGLIFTGRKYLRGPRGTGGYFVRRDLAADMTPLGPDIRVAEITNSALDWQLRSDVPRLEQWERSWSGFAGAAAALKYLSELDSDWIWARITTLAEMVVACLKPIKGVIVRRWAAEVGGIVVFDLPGRDLVAARDWLRAIGVNVMFAGPQNAPIEMLRRGERGWLRASVHYYNTEEDVERLAAAISDYLSAENR
jgi:cysteine desulfurase